MARPSKKTTEDKVCTVLSVFRGEQTANAAGPKNGVSEQSIQKSHDPFRRSWASPCVPVVDALPKGAPG